MDSSDNEEQKHRNPNTSIVLSEMLRKSKIINQINILDDGNSNEETHVSLASTFTSPSSSPSKISSSFIAKETPNALLPPRPPISQFFYSSLERTNMSKDNREQISLTEEREALDSTGRPSPPINILNALRAKQGNIGVLQGGDFLNQKLGLERKGVNGIVDQVALSNPFKISIMKKKRQKSLQEMNCIELMRYIDDKRKPLCTKEDKLNSKEFFF